MDSTLIQLIRLYEDYRLHSAEAAEHDNLASFISFASQSNLTESDYSEEISTENWKIFNRKTLMGMTTAYIGKMGRYVDNYSRANLPETPLANIDEFTYLIALMEKRQLTKSELILINGHPITTGTDIIKRLTKKEFLTELPNPIDKRSINIQITPKGRQAIIEASETMNKLSIIGTGILSNQELIQLLGMLKKLDKFHDKVHKAHKKPLADEVLEKYNDELFF